MRNDAPRAKHGILAAIMVGILAVSVAMAWLTTKPRENTSRDGNENTSRDGAEIISKLAADTLEGYWAGSRLDTWFIGWRRDVKPIGWRKRSRGLKSEGVFSGSVIDGSTSVPEIECSWRITTDLSEGHYLARTFDNNRRVVVETRITLTDDKVAVVRSGGGQKFTATAARPDNYVPEGTLPLVLRLVAARGSEVTVKMIVDRYAIMDDGDVNFVDVRLTPLGGNVVRLECVKRMFMLTKDYRLDSAHNIDHYAYPTLGIIYRLDKKEIVTETFRIPDGGAAIRAAP